MGLRTSQDDGYERISRGFREATAEGKGCALLAVAVVGLALLALLLGAWSRRDRSGARRLFRRLADANDLTSAERRLLQAVAERAGEEHAPAMFFRGRAFDETVAEMSADPRLVESLRRKVYEP